MDEGPQWVDPFSPASLREASARILTGTNYRVFYEEKTQLALIDAYRELTELARRHPQDDEAWQSGIKDMVKQGTPEDIRMRQWLIGLTKKTADNLGIKPEEYPAMFDRMMGRIEAMPGVDRRDMALLLWCGSATLTIRGSQKSRIGKSLERVVARSALSSIGLQESRGDYRLNVAADGEVERETDAEIRTPRGYVRMEVGLIGRGNSEVISDKVGRMDRNGIILMDILPRKSNAYQTAENSGVHLIQLRNNHPVEELRECLVKLKVEHIQREPVSPEEVQARIMSMPLDMFERESGE